MEQGKIAIMTLLKVAGIACIECGAVEGDMLNRGDGTKICPQCIAIAAADEGERNGAISPQMASEIRRRVKLYREGEDVPPWETP